MNNITNHDGRMFINNINILVLALCSKPCQNEMVKFNSFNPIVITFRIRFKTLFLKI